MFWLIQCWTCHVSFYQCFPELRPFTVHLSALLCAQLLSGLLSVSAFIITALVLSNVNVNVNVCISSTNNEHGK